MSDELSPLTTRHLARRLVLARQSVGPVNLARNARWQWYSDLDATSGQAPRPGPGPVAGGRSASSGPAVHLPDGGHPEVWPGDGLLPLDEPAEFGALPAAACGDRPGVRADRWHPVLPDVLPAVPHAGAACLDGRAATAAPVDPSTMAALESARHRWESAGRLRPSPATPLAPTATDRSRRLVGLLAQRRMGLGLPPAWARDRRSHHGPRGLAHDDGRGPRDDAGGVAAAIHPALAKEAPRLAPRRWRGRQRADRHAGGAEASPLGRREVHPPMGQSRDESGAPAALALRAQSPRQTPAAPSDRHRARLEPAQGGLSARPAARDPAGQGAGLREPRDARLPGGGDLQRLEPAQLARHQVAGRLTVGLDQERGSCRR